MNRSRLLISTLAVVLLLLGGCAVDQEKEVSVYRQLIDLAPPDYTPGHALTLRDALLLANQNNENLAAEGESYLRTLIDRHRAVANFLPTVDLLGDYRRRDRVPGTAAGQDRTFDLSAELQLNLFNGWRDLNRYWADTFRIEQQRNDLLAMQETILLDVAQVYYRALLAEASVRVLENSVQTQEQLLLRTRGRARAGLDAPLNVAQSEAQVAATRVTLVNARRDVINARALLGTLIGAEVLEAALVDAYVLPAEVGPVEVYLAQAEQSRHDLAAAEAAVEAARREVEVAIGRYYPSVSLDLTGFLERQTTPEERDWEGLLRVQLPIFSAGRIEADVREAWSFFRQALLVRSYLRRQIDQQVRQAHQDLAAAEARLDELQVQLEAARQALQQAEASVVVGLGTSVDQVVAQDALLEAQLQLVSSAYDRKLQYLTLLRVSGLLREELERMEPAPALVPAARPQALPTEGFRLKMVPENVIRDYAGEAPGTRPAPAGEIGADGPMGE